MGVQFLIELLHWKENTYRITTTKFFTQNGNKKRFFKTISRYSQLWAPEIYTHTRFCLSRFFEFKILEGGFQWNIFSRMALVISVINTTFDTYLPWLYRYITKTVENNVWKIHFKIERPHRSFNNAGLKTNHYKKKSKKKFVFSPVFSMPYHFKFSGNDLLERNKPS